MTSLQDIVPSGIVNEQTGYQWTGLLRSNTTLTVTLTVDAKVRRPRSFLDGIGLT
jgi:hypothetical protein